VSPRKSSTSSGRSRPHRPRYLGIEVAGESLPPASLRAWVALLSSRLRRVGEDAPGFRLIRVDVRRAVAEVDHDAVTRLRLAWNGPDPDPSGPGLRTRRTWGTLVGAKAWLRAGSSWRIAPRPNLRTTERESDSEESL